MKNEITIFIRFPSIEKLYECTVYESSSFAQIIRTLKPMIEADLNGNYCIHDHFCVFSRYDNQECDPDISLRSLGVNNGMEFLVI